MKALVVMFKEIVDNLRDRQTLFYALLFGPVLLRSTSMKSPHWLLHIQNVHRI